ncbi:MAG TPA: VanZ family protein [Gemmataceae bacterium]|nr:VanZ family protein [Gemmataceae bacterium]
MLNLLYKWRWWLWAFSTLLWTAALLLPFPESEPWTVGESKFDLRFTFAKSLHIGAYAFLTVVAGWLCAPARYRAWIIFFLMMHGTTTEVLQRVLEFLGRTGKLLDVAMDHLGVAIGMVLTWKLWTKKDDIEADL